VSEERFLTIARIVRAHGVKGELACEIVTDYPRRFRQTKRVFLRPSTRPRPQPPATGVKQGNRPQGRTRPSAAVPTLTDAGEGAQPAEATSAPPHDNGASPMPREFAVSRARVVPHTRGAQVILGLAGIEDREAADALRGWLVQVPEDEAWKLPKGQYYWHQIIGLDVVTKDGRRLGTVADILETGANDVYVVKREGGELLLPAIKDVVKKISPESGEMVVELLPGME
jgi:16S rRNA processing protein RimM